MLSENLPSRSTNYPHSVPNLQLRNLSTWLGIQVSNVARYHSSWPKKVELPELDRVTLELKWESRGSVVLSGLSCCPWWVPITRPAGLHNHQVLSVMMIAKRPSIVTSRLC